MQISQLSLCFALEFWSIGALLRNPETSIVLIHYAITPVLQYSGMFLAIYLL